MTRSPSRRDVLLALAAAPLAAAPLPGLLTPTGASASTEGMPAAFRSTRFPLVELSAGLLPYHMSSALPLPDKGIHDSRGVRLALVDGKLWNHPVAQAQFGLALLESFRITGNRAYVDLARRQAQRLIDRRVLRSGAWWYAYPFGFRVHNGEALRPPWFSMMAQGQALSLFVRLFMVTSEVAWRSAAEATYASFTQPAVARRPWGVYTVGGLLWLEEYPSPVAVRGDRTFNGHTFAAYGLYDYWRLTKGASVAALLRGALTTTQDAAQIVRRRGWRSSYCCTHLAGAGAYHFTHITQFLKVYAITTDPVFADLADVFHRDYPIEAGAGTVRFAPGRHTGYRFAPDGTVTGRRTITLAGTSQAPATGRVRVLGRTGVWYPISGGSLAGYHVGEIPGVRYRIGRYAQYGYPIPRTARVLVSALTASTIDAAGNMTTVSTGLGRGAEVAIDLRATLNGVEHLRLADGDHAGLWVGAGTVRFV